MVVNAVENVLLTPVQWWVANPVTPVGAPERGLDTTAPAEYSAPQAASLLRNVSSLAMLRALYPVHTAAEPVPGPDLPLPVSVLVDRFAQTGDAVSDVQAMGAGSTNLSALVNAVAEGLSPDMLDFETTQVLAIGGGSAPANSGGSAYRFLLDLLY